MYRPELGRGSKGGAIAGAIGINAALLLAFLQMSGRVDLTEPDQVLQTIDIFDTQTPPPEPPPPPIVEAQREKPKEQEGGSSAENLRSQATELVAPKPIVEPQRPNPVVVAEIPNQGADPTQGAANVAGPGTGAGGVGTGTGSGMGGSGPGGGGGGGVAVPVALVQGIGGRDYPREIMRSWPRGAAIFLRLRIEPDGKPSKCDVMRGFGNRAADDWTCSLIMQRGRFRPARDARGQPVAAWFGYVQRDTGR